MTRLIDADKLIPELEKEVKLADDWKTAHELFNVVKYFPTVEERPKGEWKRGFICALDKAFSEFDANCTYSGDRVLQKLEKLKEEVDNE